jgi:peptide deformylase
MTISILTINNQNDLFILRQKSTSIELKEELIKLLPIFREMKSILKLKNQTDSHNGLGLALPQIGVLKAGFIMKKGIA